MQQIPNPMANLYQAQLEVSRRFTDAMFEGAEKLDQLVLKAAHHAVSEQMRLAQVLAGGMNPADPGLAENLVRRSSGEAMNYQAEIMRVVAEMQTEFGKSMQGYIEQVASQPSRAPGRGTESATSTPTGAGGAVPNPMTSMLSMWETAFKEATAMATRNMAAARSNVQRTADMAGAFGGRKPPESANGSGASRRR